jgi:DNA-binding CsgD family transcriptional regulator
MSLRLYRAQHELQSGKRAGCQLLVTFQSACNLDGKVPISYLYRGLAQYFGVQLLMGEGASIMCNHNLSPKVINDKISSSLLLFGYDRFCLFQLGNDRSPSDTIRTLVGNWPIEKHEYYIGKKLFESDPFICESGPGSRCFVIYNELERRRLDTGFAEFCKKFGVNLGFSYYLENNQSRYILCAHGNSLSSDQGMTEETAKIIATYCWSGMALFSFNSHAARAANKSKPLTPRQQDCLHWASLGKSDWEIGKVLGLSRHTVHRHIEAAKHRLEVSTRVQAILALDFAMGQ